VKAAPNTFKASARKIYERVEHRSKKVRLHKGGQTRRAFSAAAATHLCLLLAGQFGEYGGHALPLRISDGTKSIPRVRTDDKAGHVGGNKAQTSAACCA